MDLVGYLVEKACASGGDAADAVRIESTSLGVSWRLGKPEDVARSEDHDIGLRVIIGHKQAFVSSNDPRREALDELVERAVAMARSAPEDRFCGLADPALLAREWPDLDLADDDWPSTEALVETARETEEAMLAVDGVSNSEGASASYGEGLIALATSTGFRGAYGSTSHSIGASAIAGSGTAMETDYDYASVRHRADLGSPTAIGRSAGERAVRRLNPRKVKSGPRPVVFDPRVSGSMLGHFAGAISGSAIARGTSFLRDRMGEQVFADGITVRDDPRRPRGLRSKPFDGEGVAAEALDLIVDGRLTTWLLDSTSGRQLDLVSNGRAARGTASPPGPSATNLYMAAGSRPPAELIAEIDDGFYVTSLIGFGVNGITGDYSRGAAGFWIEKGEIAFPVSELTIAGNLKDMFRHMEPADDLEFRYGTNAPTLRIDGMTIAGT